jgi:hypothetical protein
LSKYKKVSSFKNLGLSFMITLHKEVYYVSFFLFSLNKTNWEAFGNIPFPFSQERPYPSLWNGT